jgi:hypothetical protein
MDTSRQGSRRYAAMAQGTARTTRMRCPSDGLWVSRRLRRRDIGDRFARSRPRRDNQRRRIKFDCFGSGRANRNLTRVKSSELSRGPFRKSPSPPTKRLSCLSFQELSIAASGPPGLSNHRRKRRPETSERMAVPFGLFLDPSRSATSPDRRQPRSICGNEPSAHQEVLCDHTWSRPVDS